MVDTFARLKEREILMELEVESILKESRLEVRKSTEAVMVVEVPKREELQEEEERSKGCLKERAE